MELIIIPNGNGKYSVTDHKERTIYSVTKKKRFIGNPITTLHDASGYVLYTMVRTESGRKPAFHIEFNDTLYMKVRCTSMFVDPCIEFIGSEANYELKGSTHAKMTLRRDDEKIGTLVIESQANNEPKYILTVENKFFDDVIPLFAVTVDKCFNGTNK